MGMDFKHNLKAPLTRAGELAREAMHVVGETLGTRVVLTAVVWKSPFVSMFSICFVIVNYCGRDRF